MKMKSTPQRHETVDTPYIKGAGTRGCIEFPKVNKEALLEEYYPLVKTVVRNMMLHLPSCADGEELESVGLLGLIAAVDRYDPSQKKTFKGYAAVRIRGAILDELRRMDTLPRTRRAKVRRLQEVVESLEQKHGRVPTDEEISAEMGLTLKELDRYRSKAQSVVLISLDSPPTEEDDKVNRHEAIADEGNPLCADLLEKEEDVNMLKEAFVGLPERQQDILKLYYYEDMRLAEIARKYQVSEARICQIHNQALKNLRKTFHAQEMVA